MKNLLLFLFAILYINVTQAQTQIFVGDVTNGIKIGPMIGNKNLTLGLRNIAEEAFMDKGFDIVAKNDSTLKLNMEIYISIYFLLTQVLAYSTKQMPKQLFE